MAGVILGISGSIAAYKAVELMRLIQKDGHKVFPVMTESACEFISPLTFETLAKNPCHVYTFPDERDFDPEHIGIVQNADIMLTAPATANIIAKYRWGIADDLLSLTALTFGQPHIIAPAMNMRMYNNPIYRENEIYLKTAGFEFVGPVEGSLAADGEFGFGKLAGVDEIFNAVRNRLSKMNSLAGMKVLVSAGGTREMIDSVRCIANLSTGKMGYALAREAFLRGGEVTLVTSKGNRPDFPVVVIDVSSASEMKSAIESEFPSCDVLIMAAAVSDYRPEKTVDGKLDRSSGNLTLKLLPTDDILVGLKPLRKKQLMVGFAAEDGDGFERVSAKLESKGLDMIVANDISRNDIGFASDENEVSVFKPGSEPVTYAKASKRKIAVDIWNEIAGLMDGR